MAVFRLIIPHSLGHDEAEQIVQAQNYVWGYLKQPPLYSWCLKTISFVFPLNIFTLTFFKAFISFLFYFFVYKISHQFFDQNKSSIVTSGSIFFVTYFYDFNRDLTHTILATLMAAISFYVYMKLIEDKSPLNYLLLGLAFALGILSKYNFALLIFALVLTSFITSAGRKIIFNVKTLISLAGFALITSPHFIWLYSKNMSAVSYAMDRGGKEELSFQGLLKTLAGLYYEVILVAMILALLWGFVSFNHSEAKTRVLNTVTLISLIIPAMAILVFGFTDFYAKWLAPIYFLVVMSLFLRVDFSKARRKFHYAVCLVLISINLFINISSGFFPGVIGKVRNTQYPYATVLEDLKALGYKDNFVIVVAKDPLLLANLQIQVKKVFDNVEVIKFNDLEKTKKKTKLLVWNGKRKMPKVFQKKFKHYSEARIIEAEYINATNLNENYKLGFSMVLI